jgi:AAA family ATP:ADP antiporter
VQAGIREKLGLVLVSAATHAALLASYGAFRPVREALILEHNPDSIPWMFLATFIAISVVSPVWSALLARRSPRRYVGRAFHAFALCLVGFVIALYAGASRGEVGRVFYVWSAVFNLFAVSVFWSLMADLLGPSTARQLYGPIAAGGSLGAIAGPWLTQALVETIRPEGVLVMSAVLLELAAVGVWLVRRTAAASRGPAEAAADTEAETAPLPGGGALTGVAHVARSPYLSAIVGYVLCTACGATFMYLAQQRIVYDAHLEIGARTRYLASIDQWTQKVTLVLQLVVAGPAIRWLGPGLVLAVLPLARGIGLTVLGATSSLDALRVVQVIGNSATHGLTRPARELLFTVVSRDDKYRAKNAIDTIGYRLGDLASSWVYTGLRAISTGAGVLVGATVGLVAIWLAIAAALGLGFRRRVATSATESAKEPS